MNRSLLEKTAKEQAIQINGYLIEEKEIKIKKLKDPEVLKCLWDLAINRDDGALKKIVKTKASELGVELAG